MSDATLQRLESGDQGTFGHLIAPGLGRLYTGELPWRGNAASISCVPPEPGGDPVFYWATFTFSPRFGRGLYLLSPTAPRAGIRMHPANLMGDAAKGWLCQLNGCIALGERIGWMAIPFSKWQKAVLVSQSAVRRVEEYFGARPFQLEIRNPGGG
jgi:hypothetical protein